MLYGVHALEGFKEPSISGALKWLSTGLLNIPEIMLSRPQIYPSGLAPVVH